MKIWKKICPMCGKEFESKSPLKRFCYDTHILTCCICGNDFEVPSNNTSYYYDRKGQVTCSNRCGAILANSRLSKEEHAERIRQGFQKKYGVDNPGQLKSTIEKRRKTNLERYGVEEASQAPEIVERRKQTCIEKYGVEYVTQSDEFKEKSKETCLEKYGVEYATQSDEFKKKAEESMLKKYGVRHAMYSQEILDRRKRSNLEKYGVEEVFQNECVKSKIRATCIERYGVDNASKSEEIQDRIKQTCLEKYGTEYYLQSDDARDKTREASIKNYGVEHHLMSKEVQEKRKQTNLSKYGSENVFASEFAKEKMKQTNMKKYGVEYSSQNPDVRAKAIRNSRKSKLESRICDLFDNYSIEYVQQYHLSNKETKCYHTFDFYLPKYKLLIDADGVYFHSYLNDPDGKHSLDYYDDIRISLIPSDHIFHVIVEGNEDAQVKKIADILSEIDSGIFDYDSYLFRWCRSIEFPYPSYDHKRLISDWNNLNKYQNVKYTPQCRIGESIIKQFHKSIFECRWKNHISPLEAWYDDNMLKKVIRNRLIYINNVDPSKILRGFNISKICPVVSMFNPILAKYLANKYLYEFNEVFDPFSGFSGRMLGVASLNKMYTGQDLNDRAVSESNEIISFLNLSDKCSVVTKDVLQSSGQYESLLTCPPYYKKEIYNAEIEFKQCDDWISECLERFKCKRYVFVVDDTSRYSDYIVESIKSTSHFAKVEEKVIVISK